jgi:hypothetical protein
MQTIRQIVKIEDDRRLNLTLPSDITAGLMEVTIFLQPIAPESDRIAPTSQPSLFGFLPKRIDPIVFQTDLRNEWNR